MSESTEAPFSVTFKVTNPGGFEYMVTIRPNITTVEEQFEALQDVDKLTSELTSAGYAAVAGYSKPSGGGSPAAADPDAGSCEHGARVTKQGKSAKGNWTGYFCSARKCDAKWKN